MPRLLAPPAAAAGWLPPARRLHVRHLALLAIGAALAGSALAWWAWAPSEALFRYLLAVFLVWILGDLAPRLWGANEPGLVSFDGRSEERRVGEEWRAGEWGEE